MNFAPPISDSLSITASRGDAVAKTDLSDALFGHLFPAPFMSFIWPDGPELNEQLRPLILDQASRSQGLQRSNVGGWHSEVGALEFCGQAGQRLVRHMHEMVDEATRRTLAELPPRRGEPRWTIRWALHAWANVNGPGDFTQYHAHPGSTWSGAYYVDSGEPDDPAGGTPLQLFDPCQGRSQHASCSRSCLTGNRSARRPA